MSTPRPPLAEPVTSGLTLLAGARWTGWRLRLLVAMVFATCVGMVLVVAWVSDHPQIGQRWDVDLAGRIVSAAGDATSPPQRLVAIDAGGRTIALDGVWPLQGSLRWVASERLRQDLAQRHARLHEALATPGAQWVLDGGRRLPVRAADDRAGGLPPAFWLLGGAALVLLLVGLVVMLAHPQPHNLLYGLIAACQAGNLLAMAIDAALQWGFPPVWLRLEAPCRTGFDLVTAAAILQISSLHPRRLPGAGRLAALAWCVAFGLTGWITLSPAPGAWWWTQVGVGLMGAATVALLVWSRRIEAHPLAILLRHVGVLALTGWVLLTLVLALAPREPALQAALITHAPVVWNVFFAALLLLVPFLARSQGAVRELALVAGVGTFAAVVDLLLVAFFSFGRFASLTVTLFLSLGLYAAARHWLWDRLVGAQRVSTGRMFEHLYRIAREVEAHPQRTPALMLTLMADLFEPIEIGTSPGAGGSARVVADGSTLLLPVPPVLCRADEPACVIVMRFAQRGRRLFTAADARLADSVAEQLRRAVMFDQAVEQGRSEERLRLAQDLHDDIGARLLTLMYQAATPEMEDYVRHTLQDLKTLTRGLAASAHRLSHAAAEWKTDLSHRLEVARVELAWQCDYDDDAPLSVVQWSALTRVMRELVSNTIAHAGARRVEVSLRLSQGRLELSVTDDGVGRDPSAWSHGLGLGGVRKRVRQLGGDVDWEEVQPQGIRCRVRIAEFAKTGDAAVPDTAVP